MVFSSFMFLFLFLPVVLVVYFLIPIKYRSIRNLALLLFNLLFYFYGEPKGILIMFVSIAVNYTFALLLDKADNKNLRRILAGISIVLNIGILCFYKYTGFIIQNINDIFSVSLSIPDIIMPIGISFFTFQGMSYVFDVYKKVILPQKNPLNVALYISLFPQLIAGPIVRYETIASEIDNRNERLDMVVYGIKRFVFGLSKKMLLANTFGRIADDIFAMNAADMSPYIAWFGAISYSFQIFYDFSGYSDMAIGLGRVFGFKFLENFNYPYISGSITEFWHRWHISLSSWFKDYVYIPLGGNRKGFTRQLVNIFIVWGLTGLWHGAAWNFVLWGLYFATLLVIEKVFLHKVLDKLWKPLPNLYALFFIIIGWVIFRSESLANIWPYLQSMLNFRGVISAPDNYFVFLLLQYKFELIFAVMFSVPITGILEKKFEGNQIFALIMNTAVVGLLMLSVLAMVNTTFNPFIYFRF